jgi:alpha-galactosidase
MEEHKELYKKTSWISSCPLCPLWLTLLLIIYKTQKKDNNMLPTKIVVIGAGSASFGLNTLGALMRSKKLAGSELALVDMNKDTLDIVCRLAERLNKEWNAQLKVTAHVHHEDALDGAKFVVSAIEVPPREGLWRMDYEIPLRHGVRQPYAENGGPGGFAHAARNIGPVLKIAHDMEKACPDAWFINFTNPMVRICDAIHKYSKIKVVGLCHQIYAGYGLAGFLLADKLGIDIPEGPISAHAIEAHWVNLGKISRRAVELVDIQAAGLNHFTWMLAIHDKRTGEDLYPLLKERWASAPAWFEPLSQRVTAAFDCMPIPGDGHLCEYLPWLTNPVTKPWEKYAIHLYDWDAHEKERDLGHEEIRKMGSGEKGIEQLLEADSEGALEVIENVAGAGNHYHLAVNLPNDGYITNLPADAMVEIPAMITGAGVRGVAVGAIPEPAAELLRRELAVVRASVDAAVTGDRRTALQALLLDPVIGDIDLAKEVLDDYLVTYKQYLPQFWK